MKKPKKLKKLAKPLTKEEIRRKQVWFGMICAAVVAVVALFLYGYATLVPRWKESGALKRVHSEDMTERLRAVEQIYRTRNHAHTMLLCDLLRGDPAHQVRERAGTGLSVLRVPDGVPSLMFALGDISNSVADASLEALAKLTGVELSWDTVIDWWKANEANYAGAYRREEDSGLPVIDAMLAQLADDDKYIRADAVARLAKLRHTAAVEALTIASKDAEELVRTAALAALEEIAVER